MTRCTCDPAHLEVGAYDHLCPVHDRAAHTRAAELRKVRLAECRDCSLPIRFVQLDTGRLMPVDPREHAAGNVAASLSGNRLVGFVISRDHRPGPLTPYRFRPHQASCPERASKASTTPTPADPALF